MDVGRVVSYLAERRGEFEALALDIWEHPEPSRREERSSALHRERLAGKGFRVAECPEMAYSFIAERGSGEPVIALMGEYDALPGMSQACAPVRRPLVEGGPGHACGHNLLGAGALAAASAGRRRQRGARRAGDGGADRPLHGA